MELVQHVVAGRGLACACLVFGFTGAGLLDVDVEFGLVLAHCWGILDRTLGNVETFRKNREVVETSLR